MAECVVFCHRILMQRLIIKPISNLPRSDWRLKRFIIRRHIGINFPCRKATSQLKVFHIVFNDVLYFYWYHFVILIFSDYRFKTPLVFFQICQSIAVIDEKSPHSDAAR